MKEGDESERMLEKNEMKGDDKRTNEMIRKERGKKINRYKIEKRKMKKGEERERK